MAYRNGTYIAFHANNTREPTESDIKYYNLLKAWNVRSESDFEFVNSHDKASAVRDTSKRATLEASLKKRLRNSKNMILVVGETTWEDTDWVPFEIRYAVDECEIPIIAAYPGFQYVLPSPPSPGFPGVESWRSLPRWPTALRVRVENGTARILHVPFKQAPLADAVQQFTYANLPEDGRQYYSVDAYSYWGLL
jgi:hypothetical protein